MDRPNIVKYQLCFKIVSNGKKMFREMVLYQARYGDH